MRRLEFSILIIILIIGAGLRLYRLPDALMFRGDQGRDAIIAKNILKEADIALIGPVTSVGNMYLGPLYYYFMVPFLAITYPDPVGPAYGVALLSIATIYLVYWVGKQTVSARAGLLAAALYGLLPAAIIYGRFSWNPNIAPFFSIVIFYLLWKWWHHPRVKTFLLISFLIGLLVQTHYVSLTVVGLLGILWSYRLIRHGSFKQSLTEFGAGGLGFGLTLLPLIAFDFRHNHLITRQFVQFFTSPEKHMRTYSVSKQAELLFDKTEYLLSGLLATPATFAYSQIVVVVAVILSLVAIFRSRQSHGPIIIGLWLVVAAIGTSFYSHTTFVHYLTYCLPILALFWGWLIDYYCKKTYLYSGAIIGAVVFGLTASGLPRVGWSGLGTSIMEQAVTASQPYVTQPYNLVLLSDDKDYKGMSYRYFFEVETLRPKHQDDYTELETLVLIDETFLEEPLSVPIYEIEAAKNFMLEQTILIPEGPRVYIYKRG